jgi:hypothetical protein
LTCTLAEAGPTTAWSTYFGGEADERVVDVVVAPDGGWLIVGLTDSPGLSTAGAAQELLGGGQSDGFVAHVSADGSGIDWCTYVGGSGDDEVVALAIDGLGRVLVAGWTTSTDLPVVNALQAGLAPEGAPGSARRDGFLGRLAADGSGWDWLTYWGGTGDDVGVDVAVDEDGPVLLLQTCAEDLPVVAAFQPELYPAPLNQCHDAFVARFSSEGDALVLGTYLGGESVEEPRALALGADGSFVVGGSTASGDFPTHLPQQVPCSFAGCRTSAFLARFALDGSPVFVTTLPGSEDDFLYDLAMDPGGDILATGFTSSTDFPQAGWLQAWDEHAAREGFLLKLSGDGQTVLRSGTTGQCWGEGLTLDPFGNALLVGWTTDTFPFEPIDADAVNTPGIGQDACMTRVEATGSSVNYAFQFGGAERFNPFLPPHDRWESVAIAPSGEAVAVGWGYSGDYPILDPFDADPGSPSAFMEGTISAFSPPPLPQVYEPSARDARRWVDPLGVSFDHLSRSLDLVWEETMEENSYRIAVGNLQRLHDERLYNHEVVLPCDIQEPELTLPLPDGDVYFLVLGVDKDGNVGSYGRDSNNRERPAGPSPCP